MRAVVAMVLVAMSACVPAVAQVDMPSMLDNGNAGVEFIFSMPPCYEQGGSNNVIVIFVASVYEAEVTVRVSGRGVSKTKRTLPGKVTHFTLSPAEAQPFNKDESQPAPIQTLYPGVAVIVQSDKPIVAYCLTRFQFTTDGAMLTPNSSLGTEYVVGSMADMSAMYPGLNLPSEVTISGVSDSTTVWFTLGGTSATVANNLMESGQTKQYVINKGDVLAISTSNAGGDLSGSYIRSSKPVAVLSGNQCANVPLDKRWCDYVVSNEAPIHSWGTACHFPQLAERDQNAWVKIFAAESGAQVYRNGEYLSTLRDGKGGQAGFGYMDRQALEGAQQPIVFTASTSISVKLFTPGQELDNKVADPSSMQITPVAQYSRFVLFCAPGAPQLQFAENFVSLVHAVDANEEVSEDLEIGVFHDGELVWSKIRDLFGVAAGGLFPSIGDGKIWAEKRLQLPDPSGVYAIRSSGEPFAAYSYGRQDYDSYAFRTGARMIDLSVEDSRAPMNVLTFASSVQQTGGIVDLGGSGLAAVRLIPESAFNLNFDIVDFLPGTLDEIAWTATVIDPREAAGATVVMIDRAGNSATFDIDFLIEPRGELQVTPPLLNFGQIIAADVVDSTVNIANVGTEAQLRIESIRLESGSGAFEFVDLPALPLTLPPAGDGNENSLALNVRFTGREAGDFNDRIVIATDLEDELPYTRLVATTNVTTLEIEPRVFKPTVIDSTDTATCLFNIRSTVEAEILSVSQPDDPAFVIARYTGALQSVPGTLPPQAAGGVEVRFTPVEVKQYSATMDVRYRFGRQEVRTAKVNLSGEGKGRVSNVDERPGFFNLDASTQSSPSGPRTSVRFTLEVPIAVSMKVYDLRGSTAVNIPSRRFEVGDNVVEIDMARMAAGAYFLHLEAPNASAVFPLVLLR